MQECRTQLLWSEKSAGSPDQANSRSARSRSKRMSFLAPGFFYASLAVAAGVVALHFIVTRQPRAAVLPTARFVPNLPANATARATRPSDLLLMLLRVLLVLLIGAGLARPIFKPSRNRSARVILVDASRSVGDISAVRDSATRYYREGDAVILFDSAARAVGGKPADSISPWSRLSVMADCPAR
jgi:N-terminal double-transmembrane domain